MLNIRFRRNERKVFIIKINLKKLIIRNKLCNNI